MKNIQKVTSSESFWIIILFIQAKKVKAFLAAMPGRFVFIFTPKHGSWLNMIEGFFGKMTRQMLKGIRSVIKTRTY